MLEINDAIWEASIRLIVKARSAGLAIPSSDVLIVATAQYHQARLEHCDQHMDHLLKLV